MLVDLLTLLFFTFFILFPLFLSLLIYSFLFSSPFFIILTFMLIFIFTFIFTLAVPGSQVQRKVPDHAGAPLQAHHRRLVPDHHRVDAVDGQRPAHGVGDFSPLQHRCAAKHPSSLNSHSHSLPHMQSTATSPFTRRPRRAHGAADGDDRRDAGASRQGGDQG